jgi:hypothetical protein
VEKITQKLVLMTNVQKLAQQYQGTDLGEFLATITPFNGGAMSGYKLPDAIAATADDFSKESATFGLYTFQGSDVIFMDKTKIHTDELYLLEKARFLETETPSIFVLAMGRTEHLPKSIFKPMSTVKEELRGLGIN